MAGNTAIVPTLGSQTLLTDIPQILVYQIRQYITMPRSRSDVYYSDVVSLMDDVSRLSYDKEALTELVETNLGDMYKRIFANTMVTVTVTCSTEVIKDTRYQFNILVEASDARTGTVYTLAPTVADVSGSFTIKNDNVATASI